MIIIITLLAYFAALFAVSRVTGRRATNNTFYRADRRSPWYMVAFGMVGASISGVTYVSVPGMVTTSGMTYLQTCLGFIPGYFIASLFSSRACMKWRRMWTRQFTRVTPQPGLYAAS